MSSDEEDSTGTSSKRAAVSKAPKIPANGAAEDLTKALAGLSIVFTGEFDWERERLADATKKHGGYVASLAFGLHSKTTTARC